MEGHEADNLIVAYAQPALEKSMEAAVVSADKDLMQLIRPGGVLRSDGGMPVFACRCRRHYGHPGKKASFGGGLFQ